MALGFPIWNYKSKLIGSTWIFENPKMVKMKIKFGRNDTVHNTKGLDLSIV